MPLTVKESGDINEALSNEIKPRGSHLALLSVWIGKSTQEWYTDETYTVEALFCIPKNCSESF